MLNHNADSVGSLFNDIYFSPSQNASAYQKFNAHPSARERDDAAAAAADAE